MDATGGTLRLVSALGPATFAFVPSTSDLLADMERAPAGRRAMSLLFRSAEAYLETWERAVRHR